MDEDALCGACWDESCRDWFDTGGDLDDFIFYGESYAQSER